MIHLYVKQHYVTSLKYFGKTSTYNPFVYNGSGKYWKQHLKKHGEFVKTLAVYSFNCQKECTNFAIEFSNLNNIVESKRWANLQLENGVDGWTYDTPRGNTPVKRSIPSKYGSIEHKHKISLALKGKRRSPKTEFKPNHTPLNKKHIDRELLYNLYVVQKKSLVKISELIGNVSNVTVRNKLLEYRIPLRSNK